MTQDSFLAFIARLCLVVIFPFSALNKIFDFQAAMTQAAHGWIPLPPTLAVLLLVLGGLLEIFGSLCRILSPPGGAAVHILCDRHRRAVPQLLELSVQW